MCAIFKRFFLRLRFWKKHNKRNKPSESIIKTFYSKELLESAKAFVPIFETEFQVDKAKDGDVVQFSKFTSFNQDRCVCCGEVIPEGRQACPVCLVWGGKAKEDYDE